LKFAEQLLKPRATASIVMTSNQRLRARIAAAASERVGRDFGRAIG
jgi:hypothetical protein